MAQKKSRETQSDKLKYNGNAINNKIQDIINFPTPNYISEINALIRERYKLMSAAQLSVLIVEDVLFNSLKLEAYEPRDTLTYLGIDPVTFLSECNQRIDRYDDIIYEDDEILKFEHEDNITKIKRKIKKQIQFERS
jgi:hypothetical protein